MKPVSVAERARAALRHLAQQRMAPTPDAYRQAWEFVGAGAGAEEMPVDPAERALSAAAVGATLRGDDAGAPADADVGAGSTGARRQLALRLLLEEMTQLLVTVCETVPKLVDEEAWVRRQFDAIRVLLDHGEEVPDRHQFSRARAMLEQTALEHQRLLQLRRDSLQMMKSMLAQCVDWLQALTATSDRFGGRLSHFVEEIRNSTDLAALAGVVHSLIEETRAVYLEFDASKNDFAAAGARAQELQREVERLAGELDDASQLVMTDHLTGLLNRRGLEKSWVELADHCRRKCLYLSLALIDIDDFKRINDRYGHVVGDEVLRWVAETLSANMRPDDLLARFGGEEFVVLLPGAQLQAACDVITRAQVALARNVGRPTPPVSFSAGIIECSPQAGLADLLECADKIMYRAKQAGKKRIFAASGPARGLTAFDSSACI